MTMKNVEQLRASQCVPCEGGIPSLSPVEVSRHLGQLQGWTLVPNGTRIRKEWIVKNFQEGIEFFKRVAEVSESEGHHPDLHLVEYRLTVIEIWTHAIGGLSENDFILAAKIDEIPIVLKQKNNHSPG